MEPKQEPKTLAFQVHDRHVVTSMLLVGDKIITASDDTSICIHNAKTAQLIHRLTGHTGGVWAIQVLGDILTSGSTDRTVRVWDIQQGKCLHVLAGHTSTVRELKILAPEQTSSLTDGEPALLPPEPLIISASRDSTMRVWKLPKQEDPPTAAQAADKDENEEATAEPESPYFLRSLLGHTKSVRCIDAHGDTVVSGSYDFTVRAWKISTGEALRVFDGHTQKIYAIVLDHSRNRCISGSMDCMVKIWCLETGACLFTLRGHTSLVGLLALNHGLLVSASSDGTIRAWDPDDGKLKWTSPGLPHAVTCIQHDEAKIVAGSHDVLSLLDVESGESKGDVLTGLEGVWQVKFDEKRCVAAVVRGPDTYIEVCDWV